MSSPQKFFILAGLVFSLLLASYAWGMTYQELYDKNDPSHGKREAIKSGIFAFILSMLLTLGLVFVLPKFIK